MLWFVVALVLLCLILGRVEYRRSDYPPSDRKLPSRFD